MWHMTRKQLREADDWTDRVKDGDIEMPENIDENEKLKNIVTQSDKEHIPIHCLHCGGDVSQMSWSSGIEWTEDGQISEIEWCNCGKGTRVHYETRRCKLERVEEQ